MAAPLISVIIPCFRAEQYVGDALQSVRAQTYPEWEIVVVEDASHDRTEQIVNEFAASLPDHRITFVRHEKNQGVSTTRNTGIGLAKGEWIALLDHDDRWNENFLQDALSEANRCSADLVFCETLIHNAETNEMRPRPSPLDLNLAAPLDWLIEGNPIVNSSVLLRKSTLDSVGLYDTAREVQHSEDYDLWLRFAVAGKRFARVSAPNAIYREHSQQATARWEFILRQTCNVLVKHIRTPGMPRPRLAWRAASIQREIAMLNWERHPNEAFNAIRRACALWPWHGKQWWLAAKLAARLMFGADESSPGKKAIS